MFVKPLAVLFSYSFACFRVFFCCKSLSSKCNKRCKRSKESLSVRSSAQTHDRAHLRSSVWTRIEHTVIERIHVDLGNERRPSHHHFHCCPVGYWSGYVQSSASPAIERTFSVQTEFIFYK